MKLDKSKPYEEHWPVNDNGGRYHQAGTWFRDDGTPIAQVIRLPVVEIRDVTPETVAPVEVSTVRKFGGRPKGSKNRKKK